MKKDIAMALVAELRSGKILQTRGRLRNAENKMCCLGVLCNVHAKANPEIAVNETDPQCYMGEVWLVPQPVLEWADFHQNVGTRRDKLPLPFPGKGTYPSLAMANDAGVTFPEIADYIEANYEQL